MRLLAFLLLLLSAGGAAFAQRSDVVLTKNEVRAMAPEVLTRRLFGGLATLVLPIPDRGQPGVRATRPLRSLGFLMRPSRTNWDGVCQTESIAVEFELAGPEAGADTRVRPRRFSSRPLYFVPDAAMLRPPSRADDPDDPTQVEARRAARADGVCAGVDPRRTHLIGASPEYRLTALRLLLDLGDDARADRATVPLDCGEIGPENARLTDAQCRTLFARLRVGDVDTIADCDPPRAVVCHRLSVGGYGVDLLMTPNNQRLASARLLSMIVIADSLID